MLTFSISVHIFRNKPIISINIYTVETQPPGLVGNVVKFELTLVKYADWSHAARHLYLGLPGFLSVSPDECQDATQRRQWPLPSIFLAGRSERR